MYRLPSHLSVTDRPPLACVLLLAATIAGGCANPREMMTGSTGKTISVAAWRTQAAPAAEAVRRLSEGEGEVVVSSAIAVHEMRKP